MPTLDNARRWMRDRTTQDEIINGKPKDKIRELSDVLTQLTPEERQRNLEHLKAYTDYYYQGHQREQVPTEIRQSFQALAKESSRLTAVDQAREVLERYGGAPTRETIENSLERSAQQRDRQFAQQPSEPQQRSNSQAPTQTVGIPTQTIATSRSPVEVNRAQTIEKETSAFEHEIGVPF